MKVSLKAPLRFLRKKRSAAKASAASAVPTTTAARSDDDVPFHGGKLLVVEGARGFHQMSSSPSASKAVHVEPSPDMVEDPPQPVESGHSTDTESSGVVTPADEERERGFEPQKVAAAVELCLAHSGDSPDIIVGLAPTSRAERSGDVVVPDVPGIEESAITTATPSLAPAMRPKFLAKVGRPLEVPSYVGHQACNIAYGCISRGRMVWASTRTFASGNQVITALTNPSNFAFIDTIRIQATRLVISALTHNNHILTTSHRFLFNARVQATNISLATITYLRFAWAGLQLVVESRSFYGRQERMERKARTHGKSIPQKVTEALRALSVTAMYHAALGLAVGGGVVTAGMYLAKAG